MQFRFYRGVWPMAAALAVGAGAAHAGPTLDRIKSTGVITLGYRAGGAPFSYEADGNQVIGYSIDVCRNIAQAIQRQLKLPALDIRYRPVTTAERVERLNSGTIDLESAGSTNTKARREQVAFGLTYFYTGARLLVREGSGIHGLEDLKGKKLAMIKGTTAEQVLEARARQGLGGWTVQMFDTTRAGVQAVEKGQVDAVMQDDVQLVPLARQTGPSLTVVGPSMSIEPLSLMMSKADPELQALVRVEMARLFRSGDMAQIYNRWFRSPLPGRSYNLDMKLNPLLQDNFRRPSAYVTDWVVL